jgi:hypothetical protein
MDRTNGMLLVVKENETPHPVDLVVHQGWKVIVSMQGIRYLIEQFRLFRGKTALWWGRNKSDHAVPLAAAA